jgi:putative toxin-antitoxin system antitoxin component (TIGR02293 family)
MVCHMAATIGMPISYSEHDVQRGVPVTAVPALARSLQLAVPEVLEWLSISPRTWARRKQAGTLDVLEGDRVARLTRLVRRAGAVVGGADEARTWLTTPNAALDRRTPLAVAATEVGAESVFQLLGRLEHGVFS